MDGSSDGHHVGASADAALRAFTVDLRLYPSKLPLTPSVLILTLITERLSRKEYRRPMSGEQFCDKSAAA